MIDALDRKILTELSMNCRQSVNQIARKLKKSKNTILYRIKRLEEDKVIHKYQAIVDYSKTGLSYARFAIKLYNNSQAEHEKAVSVLMEDKNITWISSVQGQMNILVVLMYHDITEMVKMTEDVKKAFGKNAEMIHLSLLHRLYYCNNNMLMQRHMDAEVMDYSTLKNIVDDLDRKILEVLTKDAKTSILEIAKKTGCNDKTIIYRMKRLQKEKIILRFGIELNVKKLGLESHHILWEFYNQEHKASEKFKKYLLSLDETEYISEAIGGISHFESDMLVANSVELYDKINDLKEKFPELIKDFKLMTLLKMDKAF